MYMQATIRVREAGGISRIVNVRICHEWLRGAGSAVVWRCVALVNHYTPVAPALVYIVCVLPAVSVCSEGGVGLKSSDAIVLTTHRVPDFMCKDASERDTHRRKYRI